MSIQFPRSYEVLYGDDLGDPAFWNNRLQSVDSRLHEQEEIEKDWREAVRELTENGVQRIDDAIRPLLSQLEQDAQLGALFTATSSTTTQVGLGLKTIAITSANRKRFAAAAWIAITTTAAPYAVMIGQLVSYNRETGSMVVDVETVHGPVGLRSGFVVSATSFMDYRSESVFRTAGESGLAAATVEAALAELVSTKVEKTASITAGTGLSGGGDFTESRVLSFDVTYGDNRYVLNSTLADATFDWIRIDNTPTTLSGYGIADAYTKTAMDAALETKQPNIGYTPENADNRGALNGYAALGPDGKVPSSQLPADGSYKGTYNAATNVPAITNGSGTQGDFYIVSVGGTVAANGVGAVAAGDQLRRGPTAWQKVPTFNAVSSVAGKTGVITLESDDLTDTGAAGRTAMSKATLAELQTYLGLGSSWTASYEAVSTSFGRERLLDTDPADQRLALQLGTAALSNSSAFAPAAHVGAGGVTAHPDATGSTSGFMSAVQFTKLSGVATGANNYVHPSGDGNLHVTATGTANAKKVLTAGVSAGSFGWVFVDWVDITTKPTTIAGYGLSDAYTKVQTDALIATRQANLGYTAENVANKGTANGYPSLDGTGKIPSSQLPALAIVDTSVVATQAAMLALTAQKGDIAIRTDVNRTFILQAEPATTLANWQELRTPTDVVTSVAGRQGAVTLGMTDIQDITSFGRALLDDTSTAAQRSTIGLGNVDNTSDANKPTSTAQAAAIAAAVAPKLNAAAYTAADVLDKLLSVDADGSGLNATTVQGHAPSIFATPGTLVERDSSGNVTSDMFFGTYLNMSHAAATRATDTVFYTSNDDYVRKNTASGMRSSLVVYSKAEVDDYLTLKQDRLNYADAFELGAQLTGDRNCRIDFHSYGAGNIDYSGRIIRAAGTNGRFQFANLGAGGVDFSTDSGPLTHNSKPVVSASGANMATNSVYAGWYPAVSRLIGQIDSTALGGFVFSAVSDERVKHGIVPAPDVGLDKINAIDLISFNFAAEGYGETHHRDPSVRHEVGFSAQNLRSIEPNWVEGSGMTMEDGSDILSPTIDRIVPYLVKAIQELTARVAELEGQRA